MYSGNTGTPGPKVCITSASPHVDVNRSRSSTVHRRRRSRSVCNVAFMACLPCVPVAHIYEIRRNPAIQKPADNYSLTGEAQSSLHFCIFRESIHRAVTLNRHTLTLQATLRYLALIRLPSPRAIDLRHQQRGRHPRSNLSEKCCRYCG